MRCRVNLKSDPISLKIIAHTGDEAAVLEAGQDEIIDVSIGKSPAEKIESAGTPNNTGRDAIAEMDKAVRCLAIQVPESVYDDVKRRWDAVLAQPPHANNISMDAIALRCAISEVLLGSYMSDERKANSAAEEIVAVVAQQHLC